MNKGILPGIIASAIQESTGIPFAIATRNSLDGGCIHSSSRITGTDGRVFFLKNNRKSFAPVFAAEAAALEALAETHTLHVPKPVALAKAGNSAFLVLEYLSLNGPDKDWARMGRELARMHRSTASAFGWSRDNWIGSTPQKNTCCADWITFYKENRLRPQFHMAVKNGRTFSNETALLGSLQGFFDGYNPQPSLLHGDLWAGNAGFLENGSPVIYDPATYYGDREADLAMTELFGGFPAEFYAEYNAEWPLHPGYRIRKTLYNLYHVLNHFNLFGGGYAHQAEDMIRSLLAAV